MKHYCAVSFLLLTLISSIACSGLQAAPMPSSSSSSTPAAAVSVQVNPSNANVSSSESVQFTALVKNTPQVGVSWKASQGTVSQTGLYQAPVVNTQTTVTVTATSVKDPTKSETASVIVNPLQANPAPEPQPQPQAQSTSKTVKQFFFGADFNGSEVWPPTDGQHQIATLGAIRLWDDGVKWGQIETSKGVYNWASLDAWISRAQAQHLDVLYTFGDTPQWAGSIPKNKPCNSPSEYSCSAPTDVNQDGTGSDTNFSNFVTAVVNRYKGQIAYYELWNEADCTCYFAGTQAQLVRMGKDAAAIIRSKDPAAQILSPSAHGGTMATWFDGYIKAGGAPNFDIVDVHMRGAGSTNTNPEEFLNVYNETMAQIQKNNLTAKPLWDGEHGIKRGQMSDPDQLAGFAAREIALRAGVGLQRQYVYTWDKNFQGNDSGTAWDVVAGWLIGHTISPCVASGKIYTCNTDNGQIVWDTSQSCSHGSCSTSKYTYPTTYRYWTDLDGKKTALSGRTVGIGYKPIFLTSN